MNYNINKLKKWAKYRAKLNNIPYELDDVDIYKPSFCAILGLKLEANKDYAGPNSPTIDRIDNNKGYTADNVWIISNQANIMKSNATKEQLLLFARWALTFP